jgi:hypothetical protein
MFKYATGIDRLVLLLATVAAAVAGAALSTVSVSCVPLSWMHICRD